MAGITNPGFRRLCREQGAGFYVCEMITSRGLVERNPLTFRMIAFDADEHPRSLQLYGVDPATVGVAVRTVVDEGLADHVDLNFGCLVPKVTRRGGGRRCPTSGGCSSGSCARGRQRRAVPVTVKMRIGIDDEHRTHLEAGRSPRTPGWRPSRCTRGRRRSATRGRPTGPRSPGCATRCRRSARAGQRRHPCGGRPRHGRRDRVTAS